MLNKESDITRWKVKSFFDALVLSVSRLRLPLICMQQYFIYIPNLVRPKVYLTEDFEKKNTKKQDKTYIRKSPN